MRRRIYFLTIFGNAQEACVRFDIESLMEIGMLMCSSMEYMAKRLK